eukprot:CAMPEP_0171973864 /NCGR_PEP_ID=MMETSP0993-20121228/229638_1 /TAXON_ID=483369 /ORGANISM="non described non described, Strain CCMP2098" /LENGTH=94 /DNA_ID=CAMNT_0012624745 /DNA_START=69 /DNA_END=349 /DNA_ORIENTATION=-
MLPSSQRVLLVAVLVRSGNASNAGALAASESSIMELALRVDNSWTRQLDADPEQHQNAPNRSPRNVDQGHFVLVEPTPLSNPILLLHTPDILWG